MQSGVLASRCDSPRVVATARLAGHRLGFYGYSPVWDGGLETVVPAAGQDVWGVVCELSLSDADSLDTWQGVRLNGTGAYFHWPAEVIGADGVVHAVLVYKKDILGRPTAPSRPVLDTILAGAEEHGLPGAYTALLRGMASKPAAYPVPCFGPARQPGVLPGESCADCGSLAPPQL